MGILAFIREYVDKMKNVQELLVDFLINEDDDEINFTNLIGYLDSQKFRQNKHDLKDFLRSISKISKNFHHSKNFYSKIEKILKYVKDDFKKFYSNIEIFNIFKSNKRNLLFLFEEKILIPDEIIYKIITSKKYKSKNYPEFFSPEFKAFSNNNHQEKSDFDQKRKIGENDSYICQLIQNDLIEDFVVLHTKTNFSLRKTIEESIFETNDYIIQKKLSLIEYTTFCGSIQIFKYLFFNNVELKPSLWMFAIHGNNKELIHFLEENNIEPENQTYHEIYKESIKCFNNDVAEYISNVYFQIEEKKDIVEYAKNLMSKKTREFFFTEKLQFFNFIDLAKRINNEKFDDYDESNKECRLFYDFCANDCYSIVEILLNNTDININAKYV